MNYKTFDDVIEEWSNLIPDSVYVPLDEYIYQQYTAMYSEDNYDFLGYEENSLGE